MLLFHVPIGSTAVGVSWNTGYQLPLDQLHIDCSCAYGSLVLRASINLYPVGYAYASFEGGIGHLADIYVYKDQPAPIHRYTRYLGITPFRNYRGQGVGRTLMQRVIKELRSHGVHTLSGEIESPDAASIGWYERMGFTVQGQLIHLDL